MSTKFPMHISDDAAKALILAIAILDLGSAYVLFSYQQLFSLLAMSGLLLLALISFMSLLFLNYLSSDRLNGRIALFAIAILSAILVICSAAYDWVVISPGFGANLGVPILAALISSITLLVFGRVIGKKLSKTGLYLSFIVFALVMVCSAFVLMYYLGVANSYTPTDEVAYNYYSAYLAAHLQNPYTASMKSALTQYGIIPIPLINGSYEYYYGYPPLSFVAFLPLVPFWPASSFALKLLTMLLGSLASLIIYYESRSNRYMIIPIFAFLALSYSFNAISNTYLAISIMLVLAFIAMTKKQYAISGVLLGAAISVHQASWFAIPFFLIYSYNSFGKNAALKQLAIAICVFALMSLFFIASIGTYIGNIFGLFGSSNTFLGTNVADFMLGFFAVPNGILELLSVSVFSLSLVLYYFYNKSLVSLIALIPAFIFMLSWKATLSYSLPYIALFIVVSYESSIHSLKDRINDRRPILVSVSALVVVLVVLLLYYHAQYVSNPALNVTNIYFDLRYPPGSANNSIINMKIGVRNRLDSNQTALFLIFSSNPYGYDWVPFPTQRILPEGTFNYTVNCGCIIPINNKTELGVIMMNKNYVSLTSSNYSYII